MMTDLSPFLDDPELAGTLGRLRGPLAGKVYSDVIDGEGRQYIDLVLEGGGMLGIALVGYIYGLEQAGLRFRSVAGTSAGAIVALLLAAEDAPAKPKGERLLTRLAEMPFLSFLDGEPICRRFSESLGRPTWLPLRLTLGALSYVASVRKLLGLHPGKAFLGWLEESLASVGIRTTADLKARLGVVPAGLAARPRTEPMELQFPDHLEGLFPGELAVVSADISTVTKFVFPRMAGLVFEDPDRINPATFVRASMSVPGFFEPFRVPCRGSDPAVRRAWKEQVDFDLGPHQERHDFVDGAVISNFPIAEFHADDCVPLNPTFGAKLGPIRKGADIWTFGELGAATFETARQALDYDFLYRNPDYRHLIGVIDTTGAGWLDFRMDRAGQALLFRRGVQASADFLDSFDWANYKRIRGNLARAHAESKTMPPSAGAQWDGAAPTAAAQGAMR